MTGCDTKQTVAILTAPQSGGTAPLFHWCYVSMDFGSQSYTICHPPYNLCFRCYSPSASFLFSFLFPSLCFLLLFQYHSSSLLQPSCFFFSFAHFVLLSSHPPWFSCQDKDVVLHALSICFMPSTSNLFRLRNKSISVNILRSWIGAIKCFFCRACLGSDPQCWFEYSIKWDFNKCR